MLNFLGFRRDSKKPNQDRETDGGFVIVGETAEEKSRAAVPPCTPSYTLPSTNVIVQPPKVRYPAPPVPEQRPPSEPEPSAASGLPDLLGDVPFTLAPRILAAQAGSVPDPGLGPHILLPRPGCSLSGFQYDFSLENSVLHSGGVPGGGL